MNPWLYIKRRDVAYDTALDTLYEMGIDARFPERRASRYFNPHENVVLEAVIGRCRSCGLKYITDKSDALAAAAMAKGVE